MSNTIELITKLRDELSAGLRQQGILLDQYGNKLTATGTAAAGASTQSRGLNTAFGGLARQFTIGALAAQTVTTAVMAVKQAVQKLLSDAVRLTVEIADLTDAMTFLYGDSAPGVTRELTNISNSTGYTRSALYGLTRDVGAMTAEFANSRAEAATMGVEITRASADAAAALGLDLGTAANALQGAMRGVSRSARALGIDISEDAVQAELLRMGITTLASETDQGTLMQARYNIAMETMSRYSGAAANEMNTLEGAQRRTTNAYEEMALALGQQAEPMLIQLNEAGANLIPVLGGILNAVAMLIGSAVTPLARGLEGAAGIIGIVQDVIVALGEKIVDQIPFLDDLKGIWDSLDISWSDAEGAIRNLLGLQESEVTVTATQTAGYRTYVAALSSATEAEVRLALSLIERMNVMGALDPMMSAARERLEALRLEAEAAIASTGDAVAAALQAKKEASWVDPMAGGGGAGGITPAETAANLERKSTEEERHQQAIANRQAEDELNARIAAKELARIQLLAAGAATKDANQLARLNAIEAANQANQEAFNKFSYGLVQAMVQGQDAVEAWADAFIQNLIRIVAQQAFTWILNLFSGGVGGGIVGLFGGLFRTGGEVQGARTGWQIPDTGAFGDRVPVMVERGEGYFASREEMKMMASSRAGAGSGGGLTINNISTFSFASATDQAKFDRLLYSSAKRLGLV